MLAVLLYYPFPAAIDSRDDPTPVSLPNIVAIRSWVAELEQITIPLVRAYESARNGLRTVLRNYSLQEQHTDFSMFSTPVFNSMNTAHIIARQVKARLQEIEGY